MYSSWVSLCGGGEGGRTRIDFCLWKAKHFSIAYKFDCFTTIHWSLAVKGPRGSQNPEILQWLLISKCSQDPMRNPRLLIMSVSNNEMIQCVLKFIYSFCDTENGFKLVWWDTTRMIKCVFYYNMMNGFTWTPWSPSHVWRKP